jgi:hypothetical protein
MSVRPSVSVCLSIRTPVRPRGSHCAGFLKLEVWAFKKSPSRNTEFGYNWTTISGTLNEDLSVFHIVRSDIQVCTATIQITHCCASMVTLAIFITLLTATCTPTIQRTRTFCVLLQQCLHESATIYNERCSRISNKQTLTCRLHQNCQSFQETDIYLNVELLCN